MMPDRNRSKRPFQKLRSHNSDGLTETEHRRSSSAMDRPRPGSNSSGQGSSLSKSASRHSSSRSSRGSRSRSRSPRNSRTSVSIVMVQPDQGNGQIHEEDLAPAWVKRMLEAQELVSSSSKQSYVNQTNIERCKMGPLKRSINLIKPFMRNNICGTLKYMKSWRKLQSRKISSNILPIPILLCLYTQRDSTFNSSTIHLIHVSPI